MTKLVHASPVFLLALLLGACAGQSPPPAAPPGPTAEAGNWLDLDSPDGFVDFVDHLHAAGDRIATSDQSVRDPTAVVEQVEALIFSLAMSVADPYWDLMHESGASFNREGAERIHELFAGWGFADPGPVDAMSDRELFTAVWAGGEDRRMALRAADPSSIRLGRGNRYLFGSDDWPHSGGRAYGSSFHPPRGPVQREAGEAALGTDRAAFFMMRVRFSDGAIGRIRVDYHYDEHEQAWYPVSMTVVSEGSDNWPFPFF